MPDDIHRMLATSPLMAGLDPGLLRKIATAATPRRLCKGDILYRQGERADAVWGVLDGSVVERMTGKEGKEFALAAHEPGDFFGIVSTLDWGTRRADAVAGEDTRLFCLRRRHFLEHLQSSPELCFRIFAHFCVSLRQSTETLEETVLYKLDTRLAKILLDLQPVEERRGEEENSTVLRLTQSDLARRLGVNREAVNRHLRKWEKRGWVSLKRQQIEIHDRKSLNNFAAPGQLADHSSWGFHGNSLLPQSTFPPSVGLASKSAINESRTVSILAIDAAEYSDLLMTDAAGTLRRLQEGMTAVDKSISRYGGQLIWHAGDRILAEFSDASAAMHAALAIQPRAKEIGTAGTDETDPLFRIGIHAGELVVSGNHYLGEAINVAINLTTLATTGGILVSGQARDALGDSASLDLPFLGNHEFKNVSGEVSVYSARAVPVLRSLYLRLDALIPRRMRPLYLGAALILVVSIAWMATDRIGRALFPSPVPVNSIAVMPFEAIGDEKTAYLADGLAEEIRTVLSGVAELRVIGKTSSNYFVDRNVSTKDIGQTLRVAYLLRGTADRKGDALNVSAQLVEASSGRRIWEHEYQGSWRQFAEFRNDIVSNVSRSLGLKRNNGGTSGRLTTTTSNDEAYALYLQAQHINSLGHQRFAIDAVRLLQRAVELDPGYAEAQALLADVYMSNGVLLDRRPEFDADSRRELAARSMRIARNLKPDSSFVLAMASKLALLNNDVEQAQLLAEAALTINANDPAALSALGSVYSALHDWASAMNVLERLIALDPLSLSTIGQYISLLANAERNEEGQKMALRALALYPGDTGRHANGYLAFFRNQLGDKVGAIEAGRKGAPNSLPFDLWAGLDIDWKIRSYNPLLSIGPLAYVGRYDKARQIIIDEYMRKTSSPAILNSLEFLINRGDLEVLAGNFDQAIEFFEQAMAQIPDNEDKLFWTVRFNAFVANTLQSSADLARLHAYREAGQNEKADRIAVLISDHIEKERQSYRSAGARAEYKFLYMEAQLHAIEGRTNEALATLRSWRKYDRMLFTYVKTDPLLKNLRGIPEFHAIVAEVEAELAALRAKYHTKMAN